MKFAHSPILSQRLSPQRSTLVLGILLVGMLTLIGRALYLQAFNNDFLQKKGESRYERVIEISATRGRILDRHGDVLAISTPVKAIWAIPEDATLTADQSKQLATMLEIDPRELAKKITSEADFVFLKRQMAPDLAARVMALKLPGIHEQTEYRRYYPSGDIMAHMLGFTGFPSEKDLASGTVEKGVTDIGQEGVELALNEQLTGKPGSRRVIKDRRGQIVEDLESIKTPRDGADITLALDSKIQYLAHSQLQQAMTEHKAKAGGVVVIDVQTGEVLALANSPAYNPNNRYKVVPEQVRNRAFTDSFELGSTFKPFTAAMALDKNKVRSNTVFDTAPGRMEIGKFTIHDAHPHGKLTVAEIIQKSSNIGAARIAFTMKPEEMWQSLSKLGFGNPLKLGFPGETGGRMRAAKSWGKIGQATISYGHGISVTLVQMARAYLAFARDGDLLPLSLTRLDNEPTERLRMFSPQTAREVRAMLEMAVKPGGTAPRAQIAGYRVAGKTGTAHKVVGNGYGNKYVSSFIGFAPASAPRLIVAVMIDEPTAGKHYGGDVAAPLFSEVMAGALRTLGVPQDAPMKPIIISDAVKEDV